MYQSKYEVEDNIMKVLEILGSENILVLDYGTLGIPKCNIKCRLQSFRRAHRTTASRVTGLGTWTPPASHSPTESQNKY